MRNRRRNLGGNSARAPRGFQARSGARQLSPRATPRLPRPGAAPRPHPLPSARGAHCSVCRAWRRRPGAEEPQSFLAVPEARGRAAAAASTPRPPRRPAHPRSLLGDRGRHAPQRRARPPNSRLTESSLVPAQFAHFPKNQSITRSNPIPCSVMLCLPSSDAWEIVCSVASPEEMEDFQSLQKGRRSPKCPPIPSCWNQNSNSRPTLFPTLPGSSGQSNMSSIAEVGKSRLRSSYFMRDIIMRGVCEGEGGEERRAVLLLLCKRLTAFRYRT